MNDEQRSGVPTPKTNTQVPLPEDLTGEQALAVFEFLECLAGEIWNRYEKQMIPVILDQLSTDELLWVIDGSDDYPFDDENIPF